MIEFIIIGLMGMAAMFASQELDKVATINIFALVGFVSFLILVMG